MFRFSYIELKSNIQIKFTPKYLSFILYIYIKPTFYEQDAAQGQFFAEFNIYQKGCHTKVKGPNLP